MILPIIIQRIQLCYSVVSWSLYAILGFEYRWRKQSMEHIKVVFLLILPDLLIAI